MRKTHLLNILVTYFCFNSGYSLKQVSEEPGCVEISTTGTVIDSAVNGYYVSLGTCNNKTVFIQHNSTLWQSGHNNNGVYILYFGSFNTEDSGLNDGDVMPDKGYAFYLCDTPDTYSIDGETDSNNDNSAYCAHPGNVAGCNGSPEIYCYKLVEPEYALDNNSLYTFEDYCGEDGWKQFDGSNSDSVISTFHFYENRKCTDVLSSNTIPDPSTDKPFNTGTAGDNPNQLSEELTDVWAVLGIIIGVVIVIIGFIAMLKRGKYIWELRRANKPVILPMHSKSETNTNNVNTPNNSGNSSTRDGNSSNKNGNDCNNKPKKHKKHNRFNRFKQRGGHVTIDDIEDEEDDIDEELGAVIVSRGIHKNIHDNKINDKYHKHHVPEQPAPPIPMSSMMTHGHAAAGHAASHHAGGSMSPMASSKSRLLKSNNSNSEMLQETMIDVENDDNSNNNNNDDNNNNNQESENYEDRNENNNSTNNNNNRRKNSTSSNRNDDSNNNNNNNDNNITHHSGNNVVSNDIIDDND